MQFKKYPQRFWRHWISMPFIYMMIFPMIFFDLLLEIYHRICFPLYGLKIVERTKYIRIDRHRLEYLNFAEKFNCAYCGYANGLMRYGTTIAGETEKYWCGIKHEKFKGYTEPAHHKHFLKFGDEKAYEKACKLRSK